MTLVELMIVVAVIAIMVGAFGTSVRRTVKEQRSAAAAREIVRIFRDAKLNAGVLHIAHAVVVKPLTGVVRTLRSGTNSCLATDWAALDTQCTAATVARRAMGSECVTVDFEIAPWTFPSDPSLRIRELMLSGGSPPGADVPSDLVRTICFSPNGSTFHAQSAETLSDKNETSTGGDLGGGFLFQLDRANALNPADEFVPRHVLVPLNGLAKVVR